MFLTMARPDFIEGIYNYCDYICEKCVYTDRCYLHWTERHPDEAEKDLQRASERMAEFMEKMDADDDWEESEEEKEDREREEERAREIVTPSREIVDFAHPMLEELYSTIYEGAETDLKEAIDKIATNHILISAKYYRAVHGLPESPGIEIDEGSYWGLEDSEKTFLAMKGFLWNLKHGCGDLVQKLPEYQKTCGIITDLSNTILDRIDNDHLPLVQSLMDNYRDQFGQENRD